MLNHTRGACFSPYKALCSLQTKWGCLGSMKLVGWSMYNSSCNIPLRKELLTSNCLTFHPLDRAIVSTIQMIVGFTTGFKVSLKSNLVVWWNAFATNQALYFWTVPSWFSLILKTYLHPIACLWEGKSTRNQVLFWSKAKYSSIMELFQYGCIKAFSTGAGSVQAIYTLGSWTLMCMILLSLDEHSWMTPVHEKG